jgi:DNA-binding transcriptional regulator YiaG
MGERPPGLTLERIDNDGNYEPSNCRWATQSRQVQNSRKAKLTWFEVREIRALAYLTRGDLAERFGISDVQVGNILLNKSWRTSLVTWDAKSRAQKLSPEDVAMIRIIEGRTHQSIADEFGVDKSTVTRIRSGQSRST